MYYYMYMYTDTFLMSSSRHFGSLEIIGGLPPGGYRVTGLVGILAVWGQ